MKTSKIIKDIGLLEPFNPSIVKILDIIHDKSREISDIVPIIKLDSNITANVLRFVNSAYIGRRQKVESLDHAVTFMGAHRIFEIAFISVTAAKLKKPLKGYELTEGELWKHSAVSAMFTQVIAKKFHYGNIGRVFTAALMKDIGKTVLNRYLSDSSKQINKLVYEQKYSFLEAEKKKLGIDHATLGAEIARHWNFPPKIVDIIRHHHLDDEKMIDDPETCIVYIADTICSMMGIGAGKDGLSYPFKKEAIKHFYVSPDKFDRFFADLAQQITDISAYIEQF